MPEQKPNLFTRVLNSPLAAGLILAAFSLTVQVVLGFKDGIRKPVVQDEFGYLLAADTFSHGRLTNPTPLFWEHFESPHLLLRPTYMSKYPPGEGIALAIGQVLTHEPIVGAWLCAACSVAAIYWMLLAFISRPMAFLGGIVAALQPQFVHWGETYWGGSVAILGGALLLGAFGRWKREPNISTATILAVALLILANSRPYEGFILSVPVLAYAIWKFKMPWRPIVTALAVLTVGFAAMGYYNYRITGHASRMPTMEYSDQYDVYPKFWFLPLRPTPVYRNDVQRELHTDWERGDYDALHRPRDFTILSLKRVRRLASLSAEARVMALPLIVGIVWLEPWIWFTLIFFTLGIFAETWFLPHYAAPVMPLTLLVVIIGWRRLGKILGTLCFLAFLVTVAIRFTEPPTPDSDRAGRDELIAAERPLQSGQHLIFVKYDPGHLLNDEWVYNGADPLHQNITWVRYMGPEDCEPLLAYFHERQIWLLTVGKDSMHLDPYPAGVP